jgi:hypothetical protein
MRRRFLMPAAAALVVAGTGVVMAQIEGGDRGVAAVDSSRDFEVANISVDTTGKTADDARQAGWREAQRKAWLELSRRLGTGGGSLPDGTLDSIVSAIVVGNEQIGPTRYVAKLGVLFDRDRASSILGISGYATRSPPFVVIPVIWSGGAGTVFEQRTAWQEAWARFRSSGSEIDYIRPPGNGPDPLLLNAGQTQRPGRGWWRTVLDLYGGSDVLIPVVRLARTWPGGPVVAHFEARQGPDNRVLSQFSLKVSRAAGIPALLDEGVRRMDAVYQDALRGGYLRADPGLAYIAPTPTPTETTVIDPTLALGEDPLATAPITPVTIQFDTPEAGAVTAAENSVRTVPGVRNAITSSLALGGLSLMQVSYAGDPGLLRVGLEARGWQVFGNGATLRIRRAPSLLPQDLAPDNAAAAR